jgi:hypothetical protein
MDFDLVQRIADAVLYEGYILYPYRASATKNRQRFNFGVLAPPDSAEASVMRTECLIQGDAPVIDVRVRFLHLMSRDVFRHDEGGQHELVSSLDVCGQTHHTWQEATDRELSASGVSVCGLMMDPRLIEVDFEPTESCEMLRAVGGKAAGMISRRRASLHGRVTLRAEALQGGLVKVSVEIENLSSVSAPANQEFESRVDTPLARARNRSHVSRDRALLQSLISTHTILGVKGAQFVSLLDPGEKFASHVATCHNLGTWPVLAGQPGQRDMLLSSPIILYDYPQIAPESQGDFFDGLEMDEMLALRVMTLTDAEKHEMESVDPRARKILERTESLLPEEWRSLHGAVRHWDHVHDD